MADWTRLAGELTDALVLGSPPIAITFHEQPPEGVDAFDTPMPAPTADGRTGRVPAGCVFWNHARERTFSTVMDDHANCSVGGVTHGFKTLDDVAGNADVATLLEVGWVTIDDVPQIPTVQTRPGSVTYGPLADTPVDPDVVLLRVNGKQLMVLADALPGLRIDSKPQCHIVAVAKEAGDVRGERRLRAEPGSHRDAGHRDDLRDPRGPPRRGRRRGQRDRRRRHCGGAVRGAGRQTLRLRRATSSPTRSTGCPRRHGR